jgi:hypothetical protein
VSYCGSGIELVNELAAVVSGVDVEHEVGAGGDEDGEAEEEEGDEDLGKKGSAAGIPAFNDHRTKHIQRRAVVVIRPIFLPWGEDASPRGCV